jgi:hypothetical protein
MPDNFTPRVKRLLLEAGCRFERHGKGDHEIWHSPISNRRFMVDAKIQVAALGQSHPEASRLEKGILTSGIGAGLRLDAAAVWR